MSNLIGEYNNGNYNIRIYDDGTKIKETLNPNDNEFNANFSESIDLKITNKCDMQCPMCHENSTIDGLHGNLNTFFINTLHPYTEVAIGGGNPLEHPDLKDFLIKLKKKKVIANMTINQIHFMNNYEYVLELLDNTLINGLGISYNNYDENFINIIKKYPNIVLHIIAGLITKDDLDKLSNNYLKVLILGYKTFRRGYDYINDNLISISKNILFLKDNIKQYLDKFNVISFDNLAIKQLDIKSILSKNVWDEFYMGDDGTSTFYIDLVNRKYAKNSTSEETFDLLDNIDDMFQHIKSLNKGE